MQSPLFSSHAQKSCSFHCAELSISTGLQVYPPDWGCPGEQQDLKVSDLTLLHFLY